MDNINELNVEMSQEIQLLVKDLKTIQCKDGSTCQFVTVRDTHDHETVFTKFNAPMADVGINDIVTFQVYTSVYNNKLSHRIDAFRKNNNKNISAYFPKPSVDIKESWGKILFYYKQIENENIKKLVHFILNGRKKDFIIKPMHSVGTYSRNCGILEATLKLLNLAYPAIETLGLHKDYVLAGGILYYIGNLDLVTNGFLNTVDTALVNEAASAVRMLYIADASLKSDKNYQMDETQLSILCNILYSRAGDSCSAVTEAIVLRHMDILVQRNDEYANALKDKAEGELVNHTGKQILFKI